MLTIILLVFLLAIILMTIAIFGGIAVVLSIMWPIVLGIVILTLLDILVFKVIFRHKRRRD